MESAWNPFACREWHWQSIVVGLFSIDIRGGVGRGVRA
jgi:hypothetical protein